MEKLAMNPCLGNAGTANEPLKNMTAHINFDGLIPSGQPLALADRIERFGCAMTATQLASVLAVSRIIIYKLAKRGRIPSFRIGTCVRFDPRAVANWLRTQ